MSKTDGRWMFRLTEYTGEGLWICAEDIVSVHSQSDGGARITSVREGVRFSWRVSDPAEEIMKTMETIFSGGLR